MYPHFVFSFFLLFALFFILFFCWGRLRPSLVFCLKSWREGAFFDGRRLAMKYTGVPMEERRYARAGFLAFFFSGICAISSGVVVSLLQEKHGLSYQVTGSLLSCMNIGNMVAGFLAGLLPAFLGTKGTVLLLCAGYFLGYGAMGFTSFVPFLLLCFLLVGLAKGATLNTCTVLVGNHSRDRGMSLQLMHSLYALGDLLCPFLINALAGKGSLLPLYGLSGLGLGLWVVFFSAGLPGKAQAQKKGEAETGYGFLRSPSFWLLAGLLFCQNAAEYSVTGWLVTYFRNTGILSGSYSAYCMSIMWGATLLARLLIAFVIPIKDRYKALGFMGLCCACFYVALVYANSPLWAILFLVCFSLSMAGVNPMATACIGDGMSAKSMGVMLPVGGLGGIVMTYLIGFLSDGFGLRFGMMANLLPCLGILALSMVLRGKEKRLVA